MHGTHLRQAVAAPCAAKIAGVKGDDDGRIERIRERAYLLWERGHHGHEIEHWLQAEREIDAEAAPAAKPKTAKKKSAKRKTKAQEPSGTAR
jgi:hypothetical protein